MHFGHTYNNYGPLDYLDVGYKSNGLQIGKERATIIGSGPLASAPVASAYLGGMYLETGNPLWPNGRLYQSRYNGNYVNSGATTAKDRVIPSSSFNANLDFDLRLMFRQDVGDSVPYSGVFCQGTKAPTNRGLWIERGGTGGTTSLYSIAFYSGSTTRTISIISLINGAFRYLRVLRVGNAVTAFVDGVIKNTLDLSSFVINTPSVTTIGAQYDGERAINGNIAHCSAKCSKGGFTYEFNQSTGTTILDTSGNGNNGTLTDALPTDFWKEGWTPIQWPA